jgi:hypothetical protein
MACHLIKRPKLDNYLQRLLIFALFSQPAFVLASDDNYGNVLFTLACGGHRGGLGDRRGWVAAACAVHPRPLFLFLSGVSRLWPRRRDAPDGHRMRLTRRSLLALAGGAHPSAQYELRRFLNSDTFKLKDGLLLFTPITQDDIIAALCALILPAAILALCRQFQGRRFLLSTPCTFFIPPTSMCSPSTARSHK